MGKEARKWFILGTLYVVCVYFYVFMEWVFFVTKPSFFSIASVGDKILSLVITPLFPLIPGIVVIALAGVVNCFVKSRMGREFSRAIFCLLPAVVLASTVFLLIDNFTYTVFNLSLIHI